MKSLIRNQVRAALFDCCDPAFVPSVLNLSSWERLIDAIEEDVLAFARKDPAAHNDPTFILQAYTSVKAVLHYRLARAILDMPCPPGFATQQAGFAGIIAGRGKLLSGAEIHPAAKIGRRFVLDHGLGTVIGETAEIGDDCYMLGCATLGACGIAANAGGRRHPVIGNRVQIGAFARVFGPVHVGDDVFIGPHCGIKDDVPAGTVITLRTEHQVSRRPSGPAERCSVPHTGCDGLSPAMPVQLA